MRDRFAAVGFLRIVARSLTVTASASGSPRVRDTEALESWNMVPARGGDPAGSGLEFLVLAADGRIRIDYQFIEA
jgi:hypothetical protein